MRSTLVAGRLALVFAVISLATGCGKSSSSSRSSDPATTARDAALRACASAYNGDSQFQSLHETITGHVDSGGGQVQNFAQLQITGGSCVLTVVKRDSGYAVPPIQLAMEWLVLAAPSPRAIHRTRLQAAPSRQAIQPPGT